MSKQSHTEAAKNTGLKVGFVFDDSLDSLDGVAQQVKTYGSWLSSQGHKVSYLVGETKMKQWAGGKVYSLAKNQGVTFNRNQLSVPLPANRQEIARVLKTENFDVLHVQVPFSPFMAQPVIQQASPKTAVIGTFHILPANRLAVVGSHFLRLLYGHTLRRFDQIVSVSPAAARFADTTFGLKTEVLPNVIDLGRFRTQARRVVKRNSPHIVFLGRLVARKGAQQLLDAFELLHKKQPDVFLTIVGEGPERNSLQKFVIKRRLQAAVDFRGFVSEEVKPALLASADIACFPALGGESFGIVLIEAMASGSGVVLGGNNPGYQSVLGERPKMLIDPQNTAQFAERLQELLIDKTLATELHNWQMAEVKKYDVKVTGPELLKIYERAIVKRSKSGHN